jgi:hypothetical protein
MNFNQKKRHLNERDYDLFYRHDTMFIHKSENYLEDEGEFD